MKESNLPAEQKPVLQPFTFRGVSLYAQNPFRRIFVAQFLAALAISAVFTWLIATRFVPVITQAVAMLPDRAGLHSGILAGFTSPLLAGHKFFSIAAKSDEEFSPGNTADLQLRFHEDNMEFYSLAGWLSIPYDKQISLDLSRKRAEPWWGAWKPLIIGGIAVGFLLWLYLSWRLLSLLYMPAVKVLAWFLGRDLSWTGASRLASAALLPGAVFMGLSLLGYGLQVLSFPGLSVCFVLHFIIGWIYVIAAIFFLPKLEEAPAFTAAPAKRPSHEKQKSSSRRKSNPFSE